MIQSVGACSCTRRSRPNPPAVGVPVSARRKIVLIAEYTIRSPRDEVGCAGRDLEPAPRTRVHLCGGFPGERLHVPETIASALRRANSQQGTRQISRLILRVTGSTTSRTVRTGHDSSIRWEWERPRLVPADLVPAHVLRVRPCATRRRIAVGDVAETPRDLGGRVGRPVGASRGHLLSRESLRNAVCTAR